MRRALVIVVAFGCGSPPAVVAPVEPPAVAPAKPAPCNELDACMSQCEAGDDVGCRRLANLVAYGMGVGARSVAFPTLERSCTAGHASSCIWTPFCEARDGQIASCDQGWIAAMAELCDREAAACLELTSIYAQLGDPAAELTWRAKAIAKTAAECSAGDAFSCYTSWYGFQFYRPQHDAARAAELLERNVPVLQRGCDDGDAIQCAMVMQMWNQNEPGHEAAQQAATDRACKLAPATLCTPKP